MSRWRGKCSPAKAARILDVHVNTVYNWCHAAENGERSRLSGVQRHPVNRYFQIDLDEVKKIRDGGG